MMRSKKLARYGAVDLNPYTGEDTKDNERDDKISSRYSSMKKVLVFSFTVGLLASLAYKNNWTKINFISMRTSYQTISAENYFLLNEDPEGPIVGERLFEAVLEHDNRVTPEPFSTLDPSKDLKFLSFSRDDSSSPSRYVFGEHSGIPTSRQPVPTNRWYENMLLLSDDAQDPSENHRAYTVPYVVDAAGPIAGIRLFGTRILAMNKIVQVTFVQNQGLTLGAMSNMYEHNSMVDHIPKRYRLYDSHNNADKEKLSAYPLTPLGLTIKWEPSSDSATNLRMMSSSIVRGMPYGTMHYHFDQVQGNIFQSHVPTVVSEIEVMTSPIVDSTHQLICANETDGNPGHSALVQESVLIAFSESDFSWLVFYSHPVYVRCRSSVSSTPFILQVVGLGDNVTFDQQNDVFTSRITLMNNCTLGKNPSYCFQGLPRNSTSLNTLLHRHAHIYPGSNSKIDYTFFSDEILGGGTRAFLQFDWDPQAFAPIKKYQDEVGQELLMYSLPHHRDTMRSSPRSSNSFLFNNAMHCTPTLNGRACLVKGSTWVLEEDLYGEPSFYAPRRPHNEDLSLLAKAMTNDIKFELPSNYARGAGDTYFSGKMLAKLARILMIGKELIDICSPIDEDIPVECQNIDFPSDKEINDAIDRLRSNTEIWLNSTADSPFVYDTKWGGIVSCGCYFNEADQTCNNAFPDCPAFGDPGLDFGHAFYNDHHFHQGYHIYAAAAVAYLDPDWGKKYFEHVLVLIRDIANPSIKDDYFPTYRMKDWYLGNSWASGIATCYPNGRNQESSSESIAAYEAIALYGKVMGDIWEQAGVVSIYCKKKASVARHIRDVGRLLTATEVRSADRYWHVRQDRNGNDVYPIQYEPHVVGIMWNMMAQFQTWFGAAPYLAYGIQLLPLTPVAERRDDVSWLKQMYASFEESCSSNQDCDDQGWGILLNAVLASVGHRSKAIKYAASLPDSVFSSAGGNGHSRTNTLWYYSTRPHTIPLPLPEKRAAPSQAPVSVFDDSAVEPTFDCGCPETCSVTVLPAGGYTCRMRIQWLIQSTGRSEEEACLKVGGFEFPDICGGCDPTRCHEPIIVIPRNGTSSCPLCGIETCRNRQLNRCPILDAPYLCTDGASMGGCSMVPWSLTSEDSINGCEECCLLTLDCDKINKKRSDNITRVVQD